MRVKAKKTVHLAGHGLLEEGKEYDLDEAVAAQLIQQDTAVVLIQEKPKAPAVKGDK
jgi:hypothetical protein